MYILSSVFSSCRPWGDKTHAPGISCTASLLVQAQTWCNKDKSYCMKIRPSKYKMVNYFWSCPSILYNIILNQPWNRDIKWLELAENPSLKVYCGKLFLFSDTMPHKKNKNVSAFNNNTSHFILGKAKEWREISFTGGDWTDSAVVLKPGRLVSWASSELIFALSSMYNIITVRLQIFIISEAVFLHPHCVRR